MTFDFSGTVWYWRGPSPFHFVSVPAAACRDIHTISGAVTYGWGMIPARVSIGQVQWTTSLWPRDGGYIVPLKSAVRRARAISVGDIVDLSLYIDV